MIPRATRPMKVGRGVVLVSIELLLPLPCELLLISLTKSPRGIAAMIAGRTGMGQMLSAIGSSLSPPNLKPMTDTNPRDLIKRLAYALHDAADDVEGWGNYATNYFQKKHDLSGNVARIRAQADEARAYLAQPEPEATITEPRGCPTPGACSCPTAPYVPPELIRALELAEAALADISDTEREPWSEARAAQDLPRIRAVLARWGSPPQ
jgi:hypothetical protein